MSSLLFLEIFDITWMTVIAHWKYLLRKNRLYMRTKTLNIRKISMNYLLLIGGLCISTSGDAAVSAKAVPFVKNEAQGFNLSITGSMRTDGMGGTNSFRDSIIFKNKDVIIGSPERTPELTSSGTTWPTKHADIMFNVNNSRLWFIAEHAQGDWKYEFDLILTGDLNSKQSQREAYIGLTHKIFGAFVFGDTKGVEQRMAVGPSNFIPATGGIDGNAMRFMNQTTYVFMGPSLVGDTGVSTKALWISPELFGFRMGVSYTPNTQHLGEGLLDTAISPLGKPMQVFDLKSTCVGISYTLKRDFFSLQLSCVRLSGSTKPEIPNQRLLERNKTNSYNYGIIVGIGPVNIGAEYFANNRSGTLRYSIPSITPTVEGEVMPKKSYDCGSAGKYYGVSGGIGFTQGPTSVGFSYYYTRRNTGIVMPGLERCSVAKGNLWHYLRNINWRRGWHIMRKVLCIVWSILIGRILVLLSMLLQGSRLPQFLAIRQRLF